MNKIDIVRAVKNNLTIFTPENTGCINQESFQAIAQAIVETEKEGYITDVIAHEASDCSGFDQVFVHGEVTPLGKIC